MKKVMVFTVVVSMLFLGVPAPTDAGVLAGVATEWTQILNHVQLILGYIRQGLQLENELKQYEEQLKQGRVLPQQLFGPIQQDLSQLAQVVQGGQARVIAVQPAPDSGTHDEHGAGRAVIGPVAAVLFHPPTELRERHHQHPVCLPHLGRILEKGAHGVGETAEQPGLGVGLPGVGVETAQRDVVDSSAQLGCHELCHRFEARGQGKVRVRY